MSEWIGLRISEVLALCAVSYNEVQLLDEPPGKLKAVEFTYRAGDRPRRVRLEIQYNASELFSQDRSWDPAVVLKQKVIKVHDITRP